MIKRTCGKKEEYRIMVSRKTALLFSVLVLCLLSLSLTGISQVSCCIPSFSPNSGNVYGYPGDTSAYLTQVNVYINSECFQEGAEIDIGKPQINFIGSSPNQGYINLSDPSPKFIKSSGGTVDFPINMELSPNLPPGIYRFTITVNSSCLGDDGLEYSDSAESNRFTLTVLPTFQPGCCFPSMGPQLNTSAVPGGRTALANISITNSGYVGEIFKESRTNVTVEDLDIFPDPSAGKIFLLPSPMQLNIPVGVLRNVTLFAVLTPDVPKGTYQIDTSIKVDCEIPEAQISEEYKVRGNFTLTVESEKERQFIPGLNIPSSFSRGTCAAPGSTIVIPISSI